MPSLRLDNAPTRFRTIVLRGKPSRVDREARVIRRFSVVTRGEALGHGMWLDAQFIADVARLGQLPSKGVKSRFTHPGMSSDGTGKALGRARMFGVEGEQAFADLHLLRAASRAPDGDLAGYVMDLAEEDAEIFGTSIVFRRDRQAERDFANANTVEGEGFVSPDPLNTENLRHARIESLLAVDVVDDPAANPGGFFDASGGIAASAEAALSYVLGLEDQSPGADAFGGVNPERARQFVARSLANRGLYLARKQKEASMATEEEGTATVAKPEKKAATLAELKGAFPNDSQFVLDSLEAGRSMDEATNLWQEQRIARLELQNAELATANASLTEQAATAQPPTQSDGAEPIIFGGSTDAGSAGDFMELARDMRDAKHPHLTPWQLRTGKGMSVALKAASIKYPAAYAAYCASNGIIRSGA